MDILLTHAYYLAEDPHEWSVMKPYPPLGILYLSSHLKAAGFAVEVFDTTFRRLADFTELARRSRPPVVGIYCNMMTRRFALEMVGTCHQVGSKVVVGGPDPAGYVEEYLAHGVDVVVLGEGEETLEEVLARLGSGGCVDDLAGVKGIAFRSSDGVLIRTPQRTPFRELDRLPLPDREAIDLRAYVDTWRTHHGMGAVSLITSRGCPYKCTWCSHAVYGYTHRRRSAANVAEEVQEISERYAPDMLWYADDVFTIHHPWLEEYAKELESRSLRLPFETITREDRLNEGIVETLARMNCFRIWIGAESGSQRVLDAMQRHTNAERVVEMLHLLRRHGIETGLFIMLGYEGETEEDIRRTVEFLKAAEPDEFLTTVAYPIKGTPYYEFVKDRILATKPWDRSSDRDLLVSGRHSRRFYRYADRWLRAEVGLRRSRRNGHFRVRQFLRSLANAQVGRLGVALSCREVERGV
jgi:radical SAM superfamily enzyme YgiQ (UPF0313 family)